MRKKLRTRLKEAVNRASPFRKLSEVADHRRHAANERAHQLHGEVEVLQKELNKGDVVGRRREELEERIGVRRQQLRKERARREFWRKRYVYAHERSQHWGLVIKHRRDRLKRWIAQHEDFQPYMANGNPYEKLTPEAKHGIYLDFREGLYCTSTYEGHSGDGVHSASSNHYLENQPDGRARCWDAGAGTLGPMEKAQRREAARCPSFMVELIGPVNDCEYSNGIRYTLPEGDPLEQMHDNHKHECIRDGAPK